MKGNNAKYMPGQGPPMPQQCPETGAGYLMGGPFWAEALHDPAWLAGLIQAVDVRALAMGLSCPCKLLLCASSQGQNASAHTG